ncbi:hypothetical protein QZP89_12145 [Citrobacter werkmanii]|uniref:hypothetical protein n=1 Tax=Citrobacter werkmanii TaxID=67827 RepID=UPI00264CBAE4|nr:hypothetical protein [Citrobacter werkmanii]MDN8552564.1 hypothetical protein [Citrobacter werkmanii]
MKNLIFIVDEDLQDEPSTEEIITTLISDGEEIPLENTVKKGKSFTSSKGNCETENSDRKMINPLVANIALEMAARLLPLPVAVLVNAAPAAYSLYQLFSKKDEEDVSVASLKQSASSFDKYLKRISMTIDMTSKENYRFQPGHPQINQAYIRHPLSEDNDSKKDLYILSDSLDDILLQEREAEMIRVFVSLGATKIEFRKENKSNLLSDAKVEIDTALPVSSAETSMKLNSATTDIGSAKRVITLAGCEWKKGRELDRSAFSWLPYEPSWESIVFAREKGGCLSAELELKKKSVFSSTKEGRLGFGMNAFAGSVGASVDLNREQDENYTVYVEFNQPV